MNCICQIGLACLCSDLSSGGEYAWSSYFEMMRYSRNNLEPTWRWDPAEASLQQLHSRRHIGVWVRNRCLVLYATEILDLSIAETSARPLLLIISKTVLVLFEAVIGQLGLGWHNCLVSLTLYFNSYETLGARAGEEFAFSVPSLYTDYDREVQEDSFGESCLKSRSRWNPSSCIAHRF